MFESIALVFRCSPISAAAAAVSIALLVNEKAFKGLSLSIMNTTGEKMWTERMAKIIWLMDGIFHSILNSFLLLLLLLPSSRSYTTTFNSLLARRVGLRWNVLLLLAALALARHACAKYLQIAANPVHIRTHTHLFAGLKMDMIAKYFLLSLSLARSSNKSQRQSAAARYKKWEGKKNQFEAQTTSSLNTQKDECTAAILNLSLSRPPLHLRTSTARREIILSTLWVH
jgi:hypothetical protein